MDEDEAEKLIRNLGSPSVTAAWDRAREQLKKHQEREAALQAEFDALSMEEVRSRVTGALTAAAETLRNTPIDEGLRTHGWTPEIARGLADECDRLGAVVEEDAYPSEWGGAGLVRWLVDEVDPTTTDTLIDSVTHAANYLRAMAGRSTS